MQPSPEEVRTQLDRVLSSPKFVSSERLSEFLRFIVEETLAGRAKQIKQYTVAVKALGYDSDFDPQADPAVRIQARRLRRALDRYYYAQGLEDPIRIDVPKGAYVPVFSSQQVLPQNPDPGPGLGSRAEGATSTLATEDRLVSLPQGPSIAVLSFADLGSDEGETYLASGLTEETIIALTHFPNFLVIGPLSRGVIPERGESVRSIGQQYGVRFVLDGTVRKRGQALRLTAKLADAVSGAHLWGQALDFNLETASILEIENEVVGQVAATIADAYGVISRTLTKESLTQRTDSLSDYEAVLRVYHHFRVLTQESQVNAVEALEKTLRRDPNHALAAALLGDLFASTYQFGYEDSESLLERAEELGRKAVALDPNCQPARFTMALIHFLRGQRTLFLAECERGLQLNPNHALYAAASSLHLGMVGEWDRGLKLIDKAMRLNPHHPGWYHLVPFMNHYRLGEYNLALVEAQRFNTPTFYWDPLIRAAVLGQLDRQAEARKAVDELLDLVPDFRRRGGSLIRRFAYLDEHVDVLLEGLRKAGLEAV